MTPTRERSTDPTPRRVLQCNACGRSTDCSIEDLLRYAREGWPRCCGQTMTFYTDPTRPTADTLAPPPATD